MIEEIKQVPMTGKSCYLAPISTISYQQSKFTSRKPRLPKKMYNDLNLSKVTEPCSAKKNASSLSNSGFGYFKNHK
jgi:hypothetical protein